jgi:uncharacterized protein YkwD
MGQEAASLKADLKKVRKPFPMLALNDSLIKTAQYHASDIATKNAALSHTSTNGTDFGSRMKKAGIKYCASENISITSQSILIAAASLYLDIGLPSQGHRKTF